MQTALRESQSELVTIFPDGMVYLPKKLREAIGIKIGKTARVKIVGKRLIIEPKEAEAIEVYSDRELTSMLKADRLPKQLAREAAAYWQELV